MAELSCVQHALFVLQFEAFGAFAAFLLSALFAWELALFHTFVVSVLVCAQFEAVDAAEAVGFVAKQTALFAALALAFDHSEAVGARSARSDFVGVAGAAALARALVARVFLSEGEAGFALKADCGVRLVAPAAAVVARLLTFAINEIQPSEALSACVRV